MTAPLMTPEDVTAHFTRANGDFTFARWGRPIVPVVFGVEDATLEVVKGAVEAVVMLAGHKMAETDPELGANLMVFFFRDWDELLDVPKLDEMIPGLVSLVARLKAESATQYRAFRFDDDNAIQACFTFVCMQGAMAEQPADTIALTQAVQAVLVWGDGAFSTNSPLALLPDGQTILRPEIAGLIGASYDPVLPAAANDPAHALRLFARMQVQAAQDQTQH
ncbi:hypothetical protein SAMN05444851_1331 [Aliiroseovarius sediminilitoris]|uniref:Uncharacterized protein n=1 Tax=Aliiroseovarius sediminilitoris TaxID=1173584 RepID=A0A1I0P4K4_9RHOB|nr:hypothetical protein [Aliiroseovarius sediminilitoris]SEW08988.1 hypothetical protein SAMN05444851_1331 [Aliiroseovarius sediminilitoris]